MNEGTEASALTNSLLSEIRLQRHHGVRVLISTQEPTIDPSLLGLCSITIVHRFHSPSWFQALEKHIVGASKANEKPRRHSLSDLAPSSSAHDSLMSRITRLHTGQALLFCPTALIDVQSSEQDADAQQKSLLLNDGFLDIVVRQRLTTDGGRTVMAS